MRRRNAPKIFVLKNGNERLFNWEIPKSVRDLITEAKKSIIENEVSENPFRYKIQHKKKAGKSEKEIELEIWRHVKAVINIALLQYPQGISHTALLGAMKKKHPKITTEDLDYVLNKMEDEDEVIKIFFPQRILKSQVKSVGCVLIVKKDKFYIDNLIKKFHEALLR